LAVLDAIELQDPVGPAAKHFANQLKAMPIVAGSDSPHRLATAGTRCSWVKMSRPDLAGLKLALLESEGALCPAPFGVAPPRLGGAQWIRSLRIENLQLRQVRPLQLDFSPAYNAVIGGRGSGKSTVVECLRMSLGREQEVRALEDDGLIRNLEKFRSIYIDRKNGGMMRRDSCLTAEVEKAHGERLRYTWTRDSKDVANLTVQRLEGNSWVETGLDEAQARAQFPVRIYSQKQVLAMADKPQALLDLIDAGIADTKRGWEAEFARARDELLKARHQLRLLQAELTKKPALELERRQADRKALVFKHANFGPLLQNFQRASQQQRAMDDFLNLLERDVAALADALQAVAPLHETDFTTFKAETPGEEAAQQAALALRDQLAQRRDAMARELEAMQQQLLEGQRSIRSSPWHEQAQAHIQKYQEEMEKLKAEGVSSAQEAAAAVTAVDRLAKQLAGLAELEARLPAAEAAVRSAEQRLTEQRQRLTALREEQIRRVVEADDSLRITLRSMAYGEAAVDELRQILALGDKDKWANLWEAPDHAGGEPSGFLHDATRGGRASDVGTRLLDMKHALEAADKKVLDTTLHGTLEKRLKQLKPEDFDRLASWFPQDEVSLEYRPGRGQSYKNIAQASAGQRAAAMLSFLLAQGEEPLLLDQPEDDLDNALVSELVVQRIREGKKQRQLIVVTHNANVVVNGDAELVLHMGFRSGSIDLLESGGLQEPQVRQSVCDVMEGGRKAFEQRYKRILEDLDKVTGRP
jgi:ABC-type dipeptide/oligopeptide/nickel transport system ATPase component